ncbi:MAG: hypothetical protein AB7O62_13585 [Pirellulales bacterium]
MLVHCATQLPCPAAMVWDEVLKPSLLHEVIWPVVVIRGEDWPTRWSERAALRCRLFLFGLIPLGPRTLRFERVDPDAREIRTRETDALCRRWDHCIRVRELPDGQTRYSDTVEVDARWLTPLVRLFAVCFYRYRQRRWQRVARRLMAK